MDQDIQDFVSFYRQQGGWLHPSIVLTRVPGYGLGLVATGGDISLGEVIMKIPKSLQGLHSSVLTRILQEQLDLHAAETHQESINLTQHLLGRSVATHLSLHGIVETLGLMWEFSQGEKSFWSPYLKLLPSSVGLAWTFTEEELKYFQNPALIDHAQEWAKDMKLLYNEALKPIINQLAARPASTNTSWWTSYDSFVLAGELMNSRSIGIQGIPETFMVPMITMLNHKPVQYHVFAQSKNHRILDPTDNATIILKSDSHVSQGDQVFEDYSNRPNDFFCMHAGFVPDKSFGHFVALAAPAWPQEIPAAQVVGQALLPGGILYETIDLHSLTKLVNDNQWAYLELALADRADLERVAALLEFGGSESQVCQIFPVSCGYPGSKRKSYEYLQLQAREKLQTDYSTTLQQDLELFRQWESGEIVGNVTHRTNNILMALKYNIKEKEHLLRIVEEPIPIEEQTASLNQGFQWTAVQTKWLAIIIVLVTYWYTRRRNGF